MCFFINTNNTIYMSELFFPNNIEQQGGRPVIRFHCKQGPDSGGATFPAPVGLQVSDSANYGGVELGALGGTALNTFETVGGASSVGDAAGKLAANIGKNVGSLQKAGDAATALLSDKLGSVGKAFGIARGVSSNPNITTEFTGTNVRSFSFQYKLVPFSIEETKVIGEIIKFFRINLYPEGEILYLKYPSKWDISYHVLSKTAKTNERNLPKFGECYLTAFSTTFNGAANAFFEDGNPVEYDINFTFTETNAYTRKDIEDLL
jgi:hypothetical protein